MSDIDTLSHSRLSEAEVAAFESEGYLLFQRPVLRRPKFEGLQAHFEAMLAAWLTDSRMRSPEHMDVPHFFSPQLFEWIFDDDVLDLVEPILGPDIALFSSHFICKPAAVGKRVPWHEDSAYWRGRLDPMRVVTVWLAIDPSTPSNGCMQVIPRTHRNGYSEYEAVSGAVFKTEIKMGQFDPAQAVDCVLQPNEASLHDGRTIHGSSANTGAMRRCGFTMRFVSTRTRLTDDPGNADFPLYLARGRDHAGNFYGDPTRPNTAWLGAHKDGIPAGH
jgi:hypothetical protein